MKVVITTCDEYRWIIPVFMYFYRKYWPDNPYETEIITERKRIKGSVFYTDGVSYSSGLINYLEQYKEDKILLMMEDCLIRVTVNNDKIRNARRLCRNKMGCVRLNYCPHGYFVKHSLRININGFREYPLYERFSMSGQPAIFQKQFLLDVLRHGENVWETDQKGSKRLKRMVDTWKIIWPTDNIIDIHPIGLMKKGRFKPPVLKWAKNELKADASDESMEIYHLLEERVKRQRKR